VDQKTIGKVEEQQPTIFSMLQEWQSSIAESSCNIARTRSSFNQQRKQCRQISRSDSHVRFGVAFTSLGAIVDESVTGGPGPYSFRIQGEFYHKIGSLCSTEGQWPQLCIHDTKRERQNRHVVMPSLDPTTLDRLLTMIYNINPYVDVFKMARDMMATEGAPMHLKLCLITSRTKDVSRYNVPTADEVTALMVGNGSEAVDRHDVVLAQQADPIQGFFYLHPAQSNLKGQKRPKTILYIKSLSLCVRASVCL
jgi:hypothetical protein